MPNSAPLYLYHKAFGALAPSLRYTAWKNTPQHKLDENEPTYRPVNTGQPRWSTCLGWASSRDPISRTHMHPHKHPITHAEHSSWVWLEWTQWMSMTATLHIRAMLYWCDYITPALFSPPPIPNVIMFQEHWAHKPGHVLRCPVCQNNSTVCNTLGPRLLPRYWTTLRHTTYLMSTRFDLHIVIWSLLLRDESNLDI